MYIKPLFQRICVFYLQLLTIPRWGKGRGSQGMATQPSWGGRTWETPYRKPSLAGVPDPSFISCLPPSWWGRATPFAGKSMSMSRQGSGQGTATHGNALGTLRGRFGHRLSVSYCRQAAYWKRSRMRGTSPRVMVWPNDQLAWGAVGTVGPEQAVMAGYRTSNKSVQ